MSPAFCVYRDFFCDLVLTYLNMESFGCKTKEDKTISKWILGNIKVFLGGDSKKEFYIKTLYIGMK